jgi:hypothetical protein
LTTLEQSVLDIIIAQPPGSGIPGKQILKEMAKKGRILDDSTLTTHIIPKLKAWHRVKTRRGAGYYRDP